MKSWIEFSREAPELAQIGIDLLFRSGNPVGLAFLATLRKDGAPRLHPISLVISDHHLYVLTPLTSPKCGDLLRDGRYALQAFPPTQNVGNEEYYIAGVARRIQDIEVRRALVDETKAIVAENEVLFELLLERVMYTRLVGSGTADEQPVHRTWRAERVSP